MNYVDCGVYRTNAGFQTKAAFRKGGSTLIFTHYDGITLPAECQVVFEKGSFPTLSIAGTTYEAGDKLRISFNGCIASLSVRRMVLSAALEFHKQRLRKRLGSRAIYKAREIVSDMEVVA